MFISGEVLEHDYLVIHNGVIANSDERMKEHVKLGFTYRTLVEGETGTSGYKWADKFNDSEAIAIDFALAVEGLEEKVMSRGSAAILALQLDKKTGLVERILAWRSTNPINIFETSSSLTLSSEGPGEALSHDTLHAWDYGTFEKQEAALLQDSYTLVPISKPPVSYTYNSGEQTIDGYLASVVWVKPSGKYNAHIKTKDGVRHYIGLFDYPSKAWEKIHDWIDAYVPPVKGANDEFLKTCGKASHDELEEAMRDAKKEEEEDPGDLTPVDLRQAYEDPKTQKLLESMDYSPESEEISSEIDDFFTVLGDHETVEKLDIRAERTALVKYMVERLDRCYQNSILALQEIREHQAKGPILSGGGFDDKDYDEEALKEVKAKTGIEEDYDDYIPARDKSILV